MRFIKSIPTSILAIGGGLLIILVVGITLFGGSGEDDAEVNQNEDEDNEEITVSESENEENADETTSEEESENTTTENNEEERENLSSSQQETVENTIQAFSRHFLNLDSEQPEASIEGSQDYMTDDLYEEQKDFSYYGNWDEYKVEHDEIEVDVDPEMQDGVYKVAVESEGQAYDEEGNETKTQNVVLLLDVVQEDSVYLVDNISYEQYE